LLVGYYTEPTIQPSNKPTSQQKNS